MKRESLAFWDGFFSTLVFFLGGLALGLIVFLLIRSAITPPVNCEREIRLNDKLIEELINGVQQEEKVKTELQ